MLAVWKCLADWRGHIVSPRQFSINGNSDRFWHGIDDQLSRFLFKDFVFVNITNPPQSHSEKQYCNRSQPRPILLASTFGAGTGFRSSSFGKLGRCGPWSLASIFGFKSEIFANRHRRELWRLG